jgi:glutathione synthase/RimK-type ligase-like ATP-grasp enzyme
MHLANNEKKIADYKISSEWFSIYMGWILSNKDILVFNRRFFTGNTVNKLFTLRRALEVGFEVPETYYTNDINFITQKTLKNDFIQKPVDGGDHTKEISELTENVKQDQESLNRAITFQEKLETPEMRIFRVGNQQLAFDLYCDDLDYRVQQNAKLEYRGENIPEDLAKMNFELTEALGLEFAATDLKVCSKTGGYKILEVNSGPMFKGFDQVANGKLTSAILENLLL